MEVAFGLLALVAIICACSALGQRINLSVPLLLVLVGVVCSFLPFVPTIELNPEIVLVGLLPPLLYAAALQTSLFDFRSNRRSIGLLSVGYVIFGTVSVGLVSGALAAILYGRATCRTRSGCPICHSSTNFGAGGLADAGPRGEPCFAHSANRRTCASESRRSSANSP